jgi:prepilin-type N-terminal cleavage/methylation domain-containing protein
MTHESKTDRSAARSAGFSLVELMVAMAFVGIGLLSLGQIFIMSAKSTGLGRKDSQAANLAAEIIERMRSETFDDMCDLFDNVDTKVPLSLPLESRDWAEHVQQQLGPGARGRVDIVDETEDATLVDGLVRVDVITTWVDRGDTINLRTSVLVSKMGV